MREGGRNCGRERAYKKERREKKSDWKIKLG